MPKFGFTQESSEIVRWLKQPGEAVEQGDPIVEVTTDKVNMEVEAPASGILDGVRYQVGQTVPVTEVIAYIRSANEPPMMADSVAPRSSTGTPSANKSPEVRATPVATNLAKDKGINISQVIGTGPGGQITKQDVEEYIESRLTGSEAGGKVRATPAARRLARESGVDLAQVHGTGPRGRVQSADLQGVLSRPAEPTPGPAVLAPKIDSGKPLPDLELIKTIPLAGMRLTIATRMQKSFQDAPHITFEADIDVTGAEALRSRANELLAESQSRISLTAIIAKASAWALKRNPFVNSRLRGQEILLIRDVNIGIAVALDEGLIVPVVRAVDQKGLAQIAAEIADVSNRARTGHLRAEDVSGGTFTVSNLGMFGVDRFTAIINSPECAILAVGRVTQRIVPNGAGQPVARPIMTVTLSADHRIVDGALAARFIGDIRQVLEHPDVLLL